MIRQLYNDNHVHETHLPVLDTTSFGPNLSETLQDREIAPKLNLPPVTQLMLMVIIWHRTDVMSYVGRRNRRKTIRRDFAKPLHNKDILTLAPHEQRGPRRIFERHLI